MSKPNKSPMKKYTIKQFMQQFPTDEVCLDWLRDEKNPNGITCTRCNEVTKHHFVASRKSYSCQECGNHYHPTAGTIYHKSSTPLTTWFYVVYLMSSTRTGISAKHVERETGVTYKTAWRMCKLIREMLDEDREPMGGNGKVVEVDESYFGAKSKLGKRGRGSENKKPVVGIVERGGAIKTIQVDNAKRSTIEPLIEKYVADDSELHTDEWHAYTKVDELGYTHKTVQHGIGQYVDGDIHTNSIEGFWGNFKMGIKGAHHFVSNKHLPKYLAEWEFRYSHRNDEKPMFKSMVERTALVY